MAVEGHEGRLLLAEVSARYQFGQATFTQACREGRQAPKAALCGWYGAGLPFNESEEPEPAQLLSHRPIAA